MNTNVAIIGSNGQNAAAWTNAFIAAGFTVRNLVRFPERLPKRLDQSMSASSWTMPQPTNRPSRESIRWA